MKRCIIMKIAVALVRRGSYDKIMDIDWLLRFFDMRKGNADERGCFWFIIILIAMLLVGMGVWFALRG